MRLEQLSLINYRGFKNTTIDFDGKSVVFYGINGAGKSSILKSICTILTQSINKIANNQFKQQIGLQRDDVRFGSTMLSLTCKFSLHDGEYRSLNMSYNKTSGAKNNIRKEVAMFVDAFNECYMQEGETLPVFAYYGVNRVVLDIPLRIRTKHEFGRLETYQNSISTKTDFRTFFEWFRNQEDLENEMKVKTNNLEYKDHCLEATRSAITQMLPELSNIRIVRKPLRMCATKHGQTLSMEQLSDGEKCVVAMLGDLSRRLALANPHLENPLLGTGIVLIDEIELHMHPSWQRKIIAVLQNIFPNIQFIITTHSPMVLGELNDAFKVYGLLQTNDDIEIENMVTGYYDANLILEDKMQTPSINPKVAGLEEIIWSNLQQQDFASAEENVTQLKSLTNNTHPSITKAQILIQRGKRKLGE